MGIWFDIRAADVKKIVDGTMSRDIRFQTSLGVRDALATVEHYHKTRVIKRGGGAPVPKVWTTRSGELSRSFHVSWRPGALWGSYGSNLFRSKVIEEGKIIYPKRAAYLHFKTHDGAWVRAKRVVIPPRPTLETAKRKSEKQWMKAISRRIDKATKG